MGRATTNHLKRANTPMEYTNEQVLELKKCMADPVYFICNYVMIQHPTKGSVPFAMYPFQKNMVDMFNENRYSIVLASRQVGKCQKGTSNITIINKPNKIRKFILYFLDRQLYEQIYKKV